VKESQGRISKDRKAILQSVINQIHPVIHVCKKYFARLTCTKKETNNDCFKADSGKNAH
jgi:hypothetical protein